MKILYFSRDYSPHDHRILSALAESGHEVDYLRLEDRGRRLESRPLPPRVHLVEWAGGKAPLQVAEWEHLVKDFTRVIREISPDVVHAGPVQSAALIAAAGGTSPLVTMSWGSDLLRDAGRSPFTRWATRFVLERTRLLYADCQAVVQRAAEVGFPRERCVVFPWGVDLDLFSPAGEADLRIWLGWENAFILFSNRSFEPIYGVDLIARAFVQAAASNPQLRLLLLGQGSQELTIRGILEDGGVADRVYFAGQVSSEDLPEYYRTGDLYLSASHSDGSSVSLLEALACGRPALVSDIPGNREWILPDETGWLFPDGDAAALAEQILSIQADEPKRQEIARRSRRLAEERADWRVNSRRMLEGYQQAVAA